MFSLLLAGSLAQAQMVVLDPQNRITGGLSYTDGSLGLSLSFDSRLSQLIFINIGGFRGLTSTEFNPTKDDPKSWVNLRHGLWASPGLRFPHRYKKDAINWDFILRTGFGCVFSDVAGGDDWMLMEPAGLGGADFLLRKDKYGLRISAKTFITHPFLTELNSKPWIFNHQQTVEVFYQF